MKQVVVREQTGGPEPSAPTINTTTTTTRPTASLSTGESATHLSGLYHYFCLYKILSRKLTIIDTLTDDSHVTLLPPYISKYHAERTRDPATSASPFIFLVYHSKESSLHRIVRASQDWQDRAQLSNPLSLIRRNIDISCPQAV